METTKKNRNRMDGWEVFPKRSIMGTETTPEVRIGKSHAISLNALALGLIKNPEYVQLLYDRRYKRIGIKPVEEGSPDAYSLAGKGKTRQINFKAYLKYFGLEDLKGTKHRPKYDDGILIVELEGLLDKMRRQRILDKPDQVGRIER